ncbi:MAG: outer membrane protein assembly factor BamA [Gammaproteobacteria bacterium]|nr:outer membrane protein assembly factor BamA [Gammaproteobacteria bacterium]MCP5202024.1 outer membrane protein assembly factor BamA [Gammaproteobacteria bacterium]
MLRALIAGAVVVMCMLWGAGVQAADSFIVDDIRVEGLERISPGAVFNYLPISVGDTVDDTRSRDAVRALFKTGFFKDVRLERDGDVLVVVVVERETIADLTFEGNKAIKTDDLVEGLKEIGFAKGEVFNEAKLDKVLQELKRQYYANGKYGVRIDHEVINIDDKAVEVAFTIIEGEAARIKQINIIGNEAFPDEEILKLFDLSTPNWLSWFTKDDQYSKQKLSGDLESLRSLYLDNGYINFSVDSTQVSITPDKADVYITINVTEGDKFTVGDVKLAGTLIVEPEDLFRLVYTRKGMIFSRKALTATSKNLTDRLGNEGYAFANVNAIPDIDEERRVADITYFVDPGQRVYVRRINFFGNAKTRDEVLRREMRQMEGGWISTTRIDRSKVRLRRLGYFEDVSVETPAVPGTTDQVDVNFTVKERPSGNLLLGLGFSQSAGIIFNTNVTQDNFLGSGKSVSFAFNNSEINRTFRLGYMNPYWSIDGVSRGFDVTYSETDAGNTNVVRYDTKTISGGMTFGVPITEFHFVNVGVSYESTEINTNPLFLDPIIAQFLLREGNKYDIIRLQSSFSYDTRNAAIFPDRGVLQRIIGQMTTPGGDLRYWKIEYDSRVFIPLARNYTLLLKGLVGYGDSYGDTTELPFFENFYAGGPRTVRGYEENSLGPEDIFGRALGGNVSLVGNAEVILPVPFLEDLKSVRVSGFFDAGNVYTSEQDVDLGDMRMSVGVSGIWMSPFGLLSVSFAQPFNDQSGDEIQRFQFNFGATF